jgi:hypothetical protein
VTAEGTRTSKEGRTCATAGRRLHAGFGTQTGQQRRFALTRTTSPSLE